MYDSASHKKRWTNRNFYTPAFNMDTTIDTTVLTKMTQENLDNIFVNKVVKGFILV